MPPKARKAPTLPIRKPSFAEIRRTPLVVPVADAPTVNARPTTLSGTPSSATPGQAGEGQTTDSVDTVGPVRQRTPHEGQQQGQRRGERPGEKRIEEARLQKEAEERRQKDAEARHQKEVADQERRKRVEQQARRKEPSLEDMAACNVDEPEIIILGEGPSPESTNVIPAPASEDATRIDMDPLSIQTLRAAVSELPCQEEQLADPSTWLRDLPPAVTAYLSGDSAGGTACMTGARQVCLVCGAEGASPRATENIAACDTCYADLNVMQGQFAISLLQHRLWRQGQCAARLAVYPPNPFATPLCERGRPLTTVP